MATPEALYTGNGSTTTYAYAFAVLDQAHVKTSLNGVDTTAFTIPVAGQVQFNTAPTNGAAIRIYRLTPDTSIDAIFTPGSALRSQDLNTNFEQLLYVTQESNLDAASAITTANAATATANSAVSTANAATATANSAVSTANAATASATSATASAASAVTTANAASASAASAVSTANTANANAAAALNAAAEALAYVIVANVAAIPGSPANGDAVRVTNSTGIESFTTLSGIPVGFVGDSGLTVDIYYSSSTSSWVWVRYYAGDPENRYASAADMSQAQSDILGLDTQKLDVSTAASTYQTQTGMSSYVATSQIGSTVQAYDADTAKTDVAQTYTAQQTFAELKETVYTLGTAGNISLDPANGSIQSCVLTANPFFSDSFESGQTIVLHLEGGSSRVIGWPTIQWVSKQGNVGPALTAKDTLVLWKVATTLYGTHVGSYV